MWTHLQVDKATIENIFKPLHDRAKKYKHPWSIAELLLTKDDIEWLKAWFIRLTPDNTQNWIKTIILTKAEDDAFVSYRQMFGSTLICAAAEVCRKESREDSVWPAIRKLFINCPELRDELFLSNGQPSSLTKDVISDAVRALNLRHVMDIEGTQQWFTTIKLQFGFTYRGAKNRLAEWLVNLGRPHAVQYLIGDSDFPELTSKSFQALWSALTQYRRGLITESEILRSLEGNPWVKAHWVNDLLKEAKAKISTLGIGEWYPGENATPHDGISDEKFCTVRYIALKWPNGESPRLRFHIDKQGIEDEVCNTNISELDFYIDSRKICRWLRQGDGSWAGEEMLFAEPDTYKQYPNLNPRILTMHSGTGDILLEWDFADSGLVEEVLVFDLDREKMIKAKFEQLEPNRNYAVICDRNCNIQGCDPIEIFTYSNINRKVLRLPSSLDQNFCVVYEDFVIWQPVKDRMDQPQKLSLKLSPLTTEVLSLNDRTYLFLNGLPEDAEKVELLIHKKRYKLDPHMEGWVTQKEIKLSPELAARERTVRVRFLSNNRSHTIEPQLAFTLLGAAMYRYGKGDNNQISYEVLEKGKELNRSEGTTHLRIWTPNMDKRTDVLEGSYRVGRLIHKKIKLSDFPGHGGQLQIINDGQRYNLGVTCIDTGSVRYFLPSMLGCDAQLFLISEKDPKEVGDNGYIVYIWYIGEKQKAKFKKILTNNIQPTSTNYIWKINNLENPLSIALTWKGYWIGAWWNIERIHEYVSSRKQLSESDFAIIKWLRIPVLNSTIVSALETVISNNPCAFLKSWLRNSGLPQIDPAPKPNDHILGADTIVRHFLWNDISAMHVKEAIRLVTGDPSPWHQVDRSLDSLQKLADISPVLLWKGLEHCLMKKADKIIDILNAFLRAQVGLLSNANLNQLNYRLSALKKRTLQATALSEEDLERTIEKRIISFTHSKMDLTKIDRENLLILSETMSGRNYLSAKIAEYWIDLSK